MWSCDSFAQQTVMLRIRYIFVIMERANRKGIHLNLSDHPTLEWTEQQIKSAWFEDQPKFLFHDNDGKLGQLGRPFPGECGKEIIMSIRIQCVAVAVDRHPGITDSVRHTRLGSTHRAVDRDNPPEVSQLNVAWE